MTHDSKQSARYLLIPEEQLKALVEKWRAESDALSRSGDYGRDDMLWRIADELTAILATAKRVEVDLSDNDELMCCNGIDCGCQGITKGQYQVAMLGATTQIVARRVEVDDAMVERACEAYEGPYHFDFQIDQVKENSRISMRAALQAALGEGEGE